MMKLLNFKMGESCHFGIAVKDYAVSFEFLKDKSRQQAPFLEGIESYLENLPQSYENAMALHHMAQDMVRNDETTDMDLLSEVKILSPIPHPTALLDFGLTPKHLINSATTMMKHECGPVKGRIFAAFLSRRIKKSSQSHRLLYYKGNHLTIIGDGDEIGWPGYTSYLDIEPELAMAIGKGSQKIAGYVIFNDASARDVQFPEMLGSGPARSKDFDRGNGLGPFLVTPDEIPEPLSIAVRVEIGDRYIWHGHTSEYSARPQEVVEFCETIFPLQPGTVLGMGTIPGCTGLDNDLWINPGELVKISFDGLGTLHQRVPERLPKLEPSRWKARPELEAFQ